MGMMKTRPVNKIQYVEDAMDSFHMKYLKSFKFIHSVDVLKQMPKFNPFKEDRDGSEINQFF
jgi:hypothetical protein